MTAFKDTYFVHVYDVGQEYGGPEEGGWWYEAGEAIEIQTCLTREVAESVRDQLRNKFPRTGKRYSVLRGEDYDVVIHKGRIVLEFPENTPRYE